MYPQEKWKENVEPAAVNASEVIGNTTVFEYDLKAEKSDTKTYGLIIDRDAPSEIVSEVINEDGSVDKVVDLYAMTALSWKGLQEQQEEKEYLEADVAGLMLEVAKKDAIIEEQKEQLAILEQDMADILMEISKMRGIK